MKNIYTILAIVLTVFLVSFYFSSIPAVTSLGSVTRASEYQSTTTDSTFGTGTTYTLLQTGEGTLGSVIVTLGSNSPLELYDATTTDHRDRATTTLAKFKTTATAGTYTFDSVFHTGLIVAIPSTVGVASTTITFR